MNKFSISKLISTFFYVGFTKVCPGTFGSIATLPLWFLICFFISKSSFSDNSIFLGIILFILVLILYLIGEITTRIYMEFTKKSDPSEVVIDEVVGQLITYIISIIPICTQVNKVTVILNSECDCLRNALMILLMITPIIFFRIFDIKKPWIIGYIDKKMNNAHGVMLDDVFGGIFAGICNTVLIYLFFYFIKL